MTDKEKLLALAKYIEELTEDYVRCDGTSIYFDGHLYPNQIRLIVAKIAELEL